MLVGKTSFDSTTVGASLRPTGAAVLVSDGNDALLVNRKTSDGSIIDIRKDGTTVGSIGVDNSDNLFISGGSGHGGVEFGTNALIPSSNGVAADATVKLGNANYRYTDLYLSGGAYLGGTGSANKLDDYEEGTWTPTINAGTISATNAVYTKIGNLVTVRALIADFPNNTSTANIEIGGLPFTSASDNRGVGTAMSRYFQEQMPCQWLLI